MANTTQPAATCGAPSRRIINKIPLDFNKLRCAGLDRILAEELSKQNTRGKTFINTTANSTKANQQLYLPNNLPTSSQEQEKQQQQKQQQQMKSLTDLEMQRFNMQQYCRICMDNTNQLINIMSEPDEQEDHDLSLYEMLNDVMDEAYKIERDGKDSMPQHICNNCAAATRNAYDLRRKYEESYRYFRQQLTIMRQMAGTGVAAAQQKESEYLKNVKEEPPELEPNYVISDDDDVTIVPIKEESNQTGQLNNEESSLTHQSPQSGVTSTKEFNLRLLLIRKREQLESQEDLYDADKSKGPLQCGLCLSRCGLTNWHTHLGEHYGVGWLHGQKPPSLTRGGIIAQMSSYLKEDRENRLSCRLCNRQFGSGLGMVQHLEGCGEEFQRFPCPHCRRLYTKLSLISHQRNCTKKDLAPSDEKQDSSPDKTQRKRKPKLTPKMTWLIDDSAKRKTVDRSPFNLRLLLIRKREQLTSKEELREEGQGTGPLQCGLCLARCGKSTWKMHVADHYGVGWIKTDDKPHTMTRSGVISMMQTYLKENQGSRLICRLCGREFASGLGMILHLEGCGEEPQRIECQYCSRSYTRLSLVNHLRSCPHRLERGIPSPSAASELKMEKKSPKEYKKSDLSQSQIQTQKATKTPFNLRLLLIRNREDLDNQLNATEQSRGDGPLQCGLCLERTNKGNWRKHLSTHYGVGWPSGQEPRNLTRHSIIGQMNNYLKKNPGKRLLCRLCPRQFSSGLGMLLHLEGCGVKKHRMKCKYCSGSFTRLSLLQHLRSCEKQFQKDIQLENQETQTDIDDSGVEGEGSDEIKSNYKRKRTKSKRNCNNKWSKSLYSRYQLLDDIVAKKWKQFTQANYAKDSLYADVLPSYVKLPWTEGHELLLKSRQSKSMRFAYEKVNDECDWRELKPLEAIKAKNEYITYLGAPVRQLEWVPLPPHVSEQYLMCSLRVKMHGYTRNIDAKGNEKALMMLLKCTDNKHSELNELWPLQTTLHYGIRVAKGPVFSFAFMPSGGYIESSNRLGLLAVATATSEVHIYALPLQLTHDEVIEAGQDSVIELIPLMILCLDVKCSVQDQCTKICWSEAHGHNLLVSGYASGNVAFWDIGDVEGINCFKCNDHYNFVPLHYFYFGERNIQFLELHYDTNGTRWLAVGTSLRKLRVYDVLNIAQPVPLVGDAELKNLFKGCISWPAIWETIAIGDTSVFQINFTRVVVLSPSGVLFNNKTVDYVLDSARDMHFNCQENMLIVVTENGDLAFINVRELNMDPRAHKLTHNVRAVSYTELVKLNSGNSTKDCSISGDDFQRDYGVIIKPLIDIPKAKKEDYLNQQRRPSSYDLTTMTRFNSVRCNKNSSTHTWVAVGAEHGMLRIVNFHRNDYFT